MKSSIITALTYTITLLARMTLWRFKPAIVGVTGSVGKTSTKVAIAAVLKEKYAVRYARGNLNSELGIALTVLGGWRDDEWKLVSRATPFGGKTFSKTLFWLKVIAVAKYRLLFMRTTDYPEVLVLEYGADRPEDIGKLLKIARPDVSVITAVGEVPVHVEFYAGPEEVAREKGRLIEQLSSGGFAVLNRDDATVMALDECTRATVVTYGYASKADIHITKFENRLEDGMLVGIGFRIGHGRHMVPVRINGSLGKTQSYAAGAAAAVGLIMGINLVRIAEALERYRPPARRMELVQGIKGTLVIDDAYNASPASMRAALDAVRKIPKRRKVVVVGDMLEIGKYAMGAHQEIGTLVAAIADVLIAVGPRARFIAEGARGAGMQRRRIHSFDTAEKAIEKTVRALRKDDIVLVKGSWGMHLDVIVDALRAQ